MDSLYQAQTMLKHVLLCWVMLMGDHTKPHFSRTESMLTYVTKTWYTYAQLSNLCCLDVTYVAKANDSLRQFSEEN